MKTRLQPLPLNFNSVEDKKVLQTVCSNLPDDVEVYLIGGALRNALFRYFHGYVLPQRDYDQIITKNSNSYFKYLTGLGFVKGRIDRPTQRVMRKAHTGNPDMEDYHQWIVFDNHMVDDTTPLENLQSSVGLTVNGCALSMRELFSDGWFSKLISLPGALNDIKDKQLRVNMSGYKDQAANFFAVLRFMYVGFVPPPANEVQLLLNELPNLESERFARNVTKVWSYTNGEKNARQLVKQLGINIDVFNESEVKKLVR